MTRTSIARLADCAPVYIDTPAMNAAHAALEAEAHATASANIKMRARRYALQPRTLDAICLGLSRVSPVRLTKVLQMASYYDPTCARWLGFGGEVPAINLRGAMLYARYSRAKARQIQRKTA